MAPCEYPDMTILVLGHFLAASSTRLALFLLASLITHLHDATNAGGVVNTLDSHLVVSELLGESSEERGSGSGADVAHLGGATGEDDSYVLALAAEAVLGRATGASTKTTKASETAEVAEAASASTGRSTGRSSGRSSE
ncbi:hypothetical protein HG530_011280 [Fusarium avenaceum]|nr:hypothetical protein HG530_011280 [Fusarium avenaceum]